MLQQQRLGCFLWVVILFFNFFFQEMISLLFCQSYRYSILKQCFEVWYSLRSAAKRIRFSNFKSCFHVLDINTIKFSLKH